MNRLAHICVKTVRWSSWPLLLVIGCFLLTGYMITGKVGGINEQTALALHKLLHLPLIALLLVHVLPAVYLALRRWGWIRHEKRTTN